MGILSGLIKGGILQGGQRLLGECFKARRGGMIVKQEMGTFAKNSIQRIPVVDFSLLDNREENFKDSPGSLQLAEMIFEASSSFGYFQIIHHSIPPDVIKAAFYSSETFFTLPLDVKQTFRNKNPPVKYTLTGFRGPEMEVLGDNGLIEVRESLDWTDTGDDHLVGLLFTEAMRKLQDHCRLLNARILKLWAIGLGLEDVNMLTKFHRHWTNPGEFSGVDSFRLAYYPTMNDILKMQDDLQIKESPQQIPSALSLLFPDKHSGLQVRSQTGDALRILPLPHSVVCNIGDLAEVWTRGLFPATSYRVPCPSSPEEKSVARYTIEYISGPDDSSVIRPLVLKQNKMLVGCLPSEHKRNEDLKDDQKVSSGSDSLEDK